MKLQIVVVDLEVSPRVKRLALRLGIPLALLGAASVAYAGTVHTWADGDALNASDLNGSFQALQDQITALNGTVTAQATTIGALQSTDCPAGFAKNTGDANLIAGATLCTRSTAGGNSDEMVKVGTGPSAFWIDRYEAVLVDSTGATVYPYLSGIPVNGQWSGATPPSHAESRRGVGPAQSVTWFQASAACRAGGKRLPRLQQHYR